MEHVYIEGHDCMIHVYIEGCKWKVYRCYIE